MVRWSLPLVPLALALSLWSWDRDFRPGLALLLVVGLALADRIAIPVGPGFVPPVQLVFVPMLALLPPQVVPLLVLVGAVLGRLPDVFRRDYPARRIALGLPNSAYAFPPAAVLAAAGSPAAVPGNWDLYALAVASQLAIGIVSAYPDLRGDPALLRQVGYLLAVDLLLTPPALAAAFMASDHAWAAASVGLALLGYAQLLASERSGRIAREHEALHDPLTGLANRALFHELLRAALAGSARSSRQVVVLLVDLDRFKEVNDTHGHSAGDAVLVAVADRLRNAMRLSDSVARLGGDEFALLLTDPGTDKHLQGVVTRIRGAIETPVRLPDAVVQVGASIGAARFPDDGTDGETLLSQADAAMYVVKGAQRQEGPAPGWRSSSGTR